MQRVDEMTEAPVVGRMYLVPCIVITPADCVDWVYGSALARTWPIIGPVHEDKKTIGFAPAHAHLDPRFLTRKEIKNGYWTDAAVLGQPLCLDDGRGRNYLHRPPAIVHCKRKCQREMPQWFDLARTRGRTLAGNGLLPWTRKLEAAHASRRIKPDCRVCPHRRFPLGGLPVAEDGAVECPGHGLRWHHETGLLMPRKEVAHAA